MHDPLFIFIVIEAYIGAQDNRDWRPNNRCHVEAGDDIR